MEVRRTSKKYDVAAITQALEKVCNGVVAESGFCPSRLASISHRQGTGNKRGEVWTSTRLAEARRYTAVDLLLSALVVLMARLGCT